VRLEHKAQPGHIGAIFVAGVADITLPYLTASGGHHCISWCGVKPCKARAAPGPDEAEATAFFVQ
jgi:hypothetical protein